MQNQEYEQNGFSIFRNFYTLQELDEIHLILQEFHILWLEQNKRHYETRSINSAYITQEKQLSEEKRSRIFEFIGSHKLMGTVLAFFENSPAFMNTQLFFDPQNPKQQNYWHRDIQYSTMSIKEQKEALSKLNVIHFRIPLRCERGIELIPETHRRWDDHNEFNVRMEQSGARKSDPLSKGKIIELNVGDLLVFSANMLHRGLYGLERFAFDIIFCDANVSLVEFAQMYSLPKASTLSSIENPIAFSNTLKLKT